MVNRKIPIGIEFYKEMIDKNYYYIDKTMFIKELLDNGGKVNLFTRPRRFGKTLALSMLRTFFEKDTDVYGNVTDNSHYFENMKIGSAGDEYIKHMGQYPVIFLSLKTAKQPDFQMAYACLVDEITREYERHRYVLSDESLMENRKESFIELWKRRQNRKNMPLR